MQNSLRRYSVEGGKGLQQDRQVASKPLAPVLPVVLELQRYKYSDYCIHECTLTRERLHNDRTQKRQRRGILEKL